MRVMFEFALNRKVPPMPTSNFPVTPTSDKNMFGGKNPHGLYVPMSEDEQEVLSRLVEAQDLQIVVRGWGVVQKPLIKFGDSRVSLLFKMTFDRPAVPQPVPFFVLELKTLAGVLLLRKRYPTMLPNGQPIEVCAGMFLDLAWDIAVDHMNPALVKALKPGALGLTSRRLDPTTGDRTDKGNMKLSPRERKVLQVVEQGSARVRRDDAVATVKATKNAGYEIKQTNKGPEAADLD